MIIVEPTSGLCNRMRVIDSAIMLALEMNRPLVIIWNIENDLGASFDALFERIPNAKMVQFHCKNRITKKLQHWLRKFYTVGSYKVTAEEIQAGKEHQLDCNSLAKHSKVYFHTCEAFWPSNRTFSDFVPAPQVKKCVDSLTSSTMIGLHIRRSDHSESIACSPTQLFVDAVENEVSLNPLAKFYLATDDPKEEAFLLGKFGDRIVMQKSRCFDRADSHAIQQAAIDLYCLARCKKIYGSFWSSFSQVAAKIGNIELHVLEQQRAKI